MNFVMSMETGQEEVPHEAAAGAGLPQSDAETLPVAHVPEPLHMHELAELKDIVSSPHCAESGSVCGVMDRWMMTW